MRVLLSLLFLLASFGAHACSCDDAPLNEQTARDAQHVFIFRMIEAKFVSERDGPVVSESAYGSIRFVESIRGNGEAFTSLQFNFSECCGTRLDVGHYYIAFVSGSGPSFFASVGTIVDITSEYREDSDYPRSEDGVVSRVQRLLEGTLSLDAALHPLMRQSVSQVPPPPPPCPRVAASPET